MEDDKYVVFKREDWLRFLNESPAYSIMSIPLPLSDAVVLRYSDAFTATALQAYCDQIAATMELLQVVGYPSVTMHDRLARLHDKFSDFVHAAGNYPHRKVPD
jgi:hypothetical protein